MAHTLTEDEVADEIAKDGFLSPLLDQYKTTIINEHAEWFEFAQRLNRVVVAMWLGHPIKTEGQSPNDPEPLAVRLMARSMNGFEAAVIVLERGMTVEGGTLARSIYETGFWLAYLNEHPVAARKHFILDELLGKIGRHTAYERLYAKVPERLAEIKKTLVDLRKQRATTTLKKLDVAEVSKLGNTTDFYAFYKVLCGSSAHASILSTNHYLQHFDDETVGHTIGPDIEGTARKLAFACHALLLSSLGFAAITEAPATLELLELTKEFYQRGSEFEFGTLN